MEQRFKENLELARRTQRLLGIKMDAYLNGPNLDNTGKGIDRQPKPLKGGGTEPSLVSNESASTTGNDDRDQVAARAAMRGIDTSKTVNLNLPGGDSHITGKVGGKSKDTVVKDWKDPGSDPMLQKGTAITKLTHLAVPITRPIRAETVDGVTSFHFNHEAIAKTKIERVSATSRKTRPGSAKDHAAYIERDAAVARSMGASADDNDGLEKSETEPEKIAVEKSGGLNPDGDEQTLAEDAAELGEAAVGGAYIEREEAIAHEADGAPVLFTNIDADPAERRKFWELVEVHEREPGEDYMRIRIGNNLDFWLAVFSDPDCPTYDIKPTKKGDPSNEVRIHTESNDRMRVLMRRHGWTPPKRRNLEGLTQGEQAAVDFQQDKADGFVFEDARGGRIQCRIIGELPYEVSHEARVRILRGFAQEFERRDIPYVGVMHAPDHTNSDKNWHFHLIYHDRPAARFVNDPSHPVNAHLAPNPKGAAQTENMKAEARAILGTSEFDKFEGQWNFSIPYTRKSASRNVRTRYPFAQPKLRECSDKDFIPKLRQVLADITNEELDVAGQRRRVDPRKYSDFGIDRPTDKHLGTQAAQLEISGINTDIGRQNELNQWVYQMTQIQRYQVIELTKLREDIERTRRFNQDAIGDDPRSELIEHHINRYEQLRQAAIEHAVIARTMQENIDRAASRANKVKLMCEKHLKAIADNKASKQHIRHKSDYEAKLNEALIHLAGLKILFADEALQIVRSTEQAKLLQAEAEELRSENDKLVKQVQADRSIGKLQAALVESSTKRIQPMDVDHEIGTSDDDARALTKEQIDSFIDTVLKENIRLVIRDRKYIPAVDDPRFAAIVIAPNFASFQARLKGIHANQVEAISKLLKVLDDKPEALQSIVGPDGRAIVTLKINDKQLQAALQSYQHDKAVSRAIDRAIALQKPSESLAEAVSKVPSSIVTPRPVPAQPTVQPPAQPPVAPPEPYPYQELVRRALFERSLSGVRWAENNGKKSLVLTNASAERFKIPTNIQIAPEVVPFIEKIIDAADREEQRLRKYIERMPTGRIEVSPLRIILPGFADKELLDIAEKHSNDPERRALYAAMPKIANSSERSSLQFYEDFAASKEGKAAAKAAAERTTIERTSGPVRKRADDNKPDPRFANVNLDIIRDRGRKLKIGMHPMLDTYLLADTRGDEVARRLVAEEIVKDREAASVAKRLTREDQARIKDDSQYNHITRVNNIKRQNSWGPDISHQLDRGLSPKAD